MRYFFDEKGFSDIAFGIDIKGKNVIWEHYLTKGEGTSEDAFDVVLGMKIDDAVLDFDGNILT